MQDRFKFRHWDKRINIMFNSLRNDNFGEYAHNDNIITMQCTGLKDKNGKLIYEGDIVFYKINSIKCKDVVRWSDDSCGWVKGCQDLCTYKKHCEVVGNIYENPELLKGDD